MSKQPPSAPTPSAIGPCPTIIQIVGRPGTRSLPRAIAPPDHPRQPTDIYYHVIIEIANVSFVIWCVAYFGLNSLLRQYFSLDRAVSQREGERREKR